MIRPGFWQYLYVLLFPLFLIGVAIATLIYGVVAQTADWGNRVVAALFFAAFGLIPAVYVFGLRVEVTREQVSKIFLFGLLREMIPLDELAVNVDREYDSGVPVSLARFVRTGGKGAFNLYRSWVWKGSDVDHLLGLAARPIPPDDSTSRQNGRLIGAVVIIGLAAFVLFLIWVWNMSPNRT